MGLDLGVLDLCNLVAPDRPAPDVLRHTLEMARLADRLGYSRYWLGEHHGPVSASGSPEMLLPLIASQTRRIRVGTGGVLLPFYSSFKVAANFRLLEALYPGRVEVGLARGPPSKPLQAALTDRADGAVPEILMEQKVLDTLAYLRGPQPDDHRFPAAQPVPHGVRAPGVWLLAAGSHHTLEFAAMHGLGLAWSVYLNKGHPGAPSLIQRHYVDRFVPSAEFHAPRIALAVNVVCAPTRDEAESTVQGHLRAGFHSNVVGTPEECAQTMEVMAGEFGTTEFLVLPGSNTPTKRIRTLKLLAQACGLDARGHAVEAVA